LVNKDGKAGVVILILALFILIALMPWYFIVAGNLDFFNFFDRSPAVAGEASDEDTAIAEDEDPSSEDEPEEDPESDSEQGSAYETTIEDTVISLLNAYPDLHRDLNAIATSFNTTAVSLVAYDGDTGEYYTYEHGHADVEARRRVDEDTKFRVASLAKLTTAICIMSLVDDGLIDLDTDISVYLGYEVRNPQYQTDIITTRMLLQHTSSVFDSGPFQMSRDRDSSESVRFLLERGSPGGQSTSFRRNQPGTHFEYTNFGYSVLGAICENVAGKSLDTFSREILFEPLGIDAAYVPDNLTDTENIAVLYNERHVITRSVESQLEVGESALLGHDLHLAQGNLTISALDYAKILVMLGNRGTLYGTRILSQEAVRLMHITDVQGASYEQGLATRYSFGDFITNEGFFWHTGSAYGAFAQYIYGANPYMNRGVVVITTGAATEREDNGMVSVCTEMSLIVWEGLGFSDGIHSN